MHRPPDIQSKPDSWAPDSSTSQAATATVQRPDTQVPASTNDAENPRAKQAAVRCNAREEHAERTTGHAGHQQEPVYLTGNGHEHHTHPDGDRPDQQLIRQLGQMSAIPKNSGG